MGGYFGDKRPTWLAPPSSFPPASPLRGAMFVSSRGCCAHRGVENRLVRAVPMRAHALEGGRDGCMSLVPNITSSWYSISH